ncbi:MAG: hypothetical protein GY799_13700 [Desulfobulbaceae bacterium]|nr:hypothetical protein [Desulfobulbaceae bacterium]
MTKEFGMNIPVVILSFFGCEQSEVADVFRESVTDRRKYKDLDIVVGVQKQVKSYDEINKAWEELREEGKRPGQLKLYTR